MANAREGETVPNPHFHPREESLLRSGHDKHGDNTRLQSELKMDQNVAENNEKIRSEGKSKQRIIIGYE